MAEEISANRVIEKFGGQSEMARLLGIARATIQYWAKTDRIPRKRLKEVIRIAGENGIDLTPEGVVERGEYDRGMEDGFRLCLEVVCRRLRQIKGWRSGPWLAEKFQRMAITLHAEEIGDIEFGLSPGWGPAMIPPRSKPDPSGEPYPREDRRVEAE